MQNKKKNNWIWFILIIIILIILLMSCSKKTTAPTSNSTSNTTKKSATCEISYEKDQAKWKTYSNDTVKINFKYPETFTIGIENAADIMITANSTSDCHSVMFITYIDRVPETACQTGPDTITSQVAGKSSCETKSQMKSGNKIEYRQQYIFHSGVRDYTIKASTYNQSDLDVFDQIVKSIALK